MELTQENSLKTPYRGGFPDLVPATLVLKTWLTERSFLLSLRVTCRHLYMYVGKHFGCGGLELRVKGSKVTDSEDTLMKAGIGDKSVLVAQKEVPLVQGNAGHNERRTFPVLQERVFEDMDGKDLEQINAFLRGTQEQEDDKRTDQKRRETEEDRKKPAEGTTPDQFRMGRPGRE